MVNGRFSGDDEGPQERREDAESVPSTSENHVKKLKKLKRHVHKDVLTEDGHFSSMFRLATSR